MFFLGLLIFFIAVVSHEFVKVYRLKAIETGEADLSPADRSILPLCNVCKVCSIIAFFILLCTGIFMLAAKTDDSNVLILSEKQWTEIHVTFVMMFAVLFMFLTYIHWNWFRKVFYSKVHRAE